MPPFTPQRKIDFFTTNPVSRARLLGVLVGMAALLTGRLGAAPDAVALSPISTVQILNRQEAAQARPVRVRGVITFIDPPNLTIQDETGGIWVDVGLARRRRVWQGNERLLQTAQVGMEVEITGVTDSGGFAPIVVPATLRILGTKPLPPAAPLVPARFFSGADTRRRVEARGVVQSVTQQQGFWELRLDLNPGQVNIEVPGVLPVAATEWVDAEVSLVGVTMTQFNTRGEALWPLVRAVSPEDIRIEKAPPRLEDLPKVPLDQIQAFSPEPRGGHRLRVEGTVTYALSGQYFYLQEGPCAVKVKTRSPEMYPIGSRVEVAGFVESDGAVGQIHDAVVRLIGSGPAPAALEITPREIMEINHKAAWARRLAQPSDYIGQLVRFRAHLLAIEHSVDGNAGQRRLILTQADLTVSAVAQSTDAALLDSLQAGSEVEVTGIAELGFEIDSNRFHFLKPVRVDLVLRSASDVTVLQAPGWWTPLKLSVLLAGVLLVLGAVMAWALMLRREVARQLKIVSSKLSQEVISEERIRIARDLHDTLEQQLAGVALQLDSAGKALKTRPEVATGAMDLAGKMLRYTRLEARRSIWDLRSQVLEANGLEAALRVMAESFTTAEGTQVEVRVSGTRRAVPIGIDFQLLRVAQESLANAIKHAQARHITIELSGDSEATCLRISDDGRGFAPEMTEATAGAHFGVIGMRERAYKIGAELTLRSEPGAGCDVILRLPTPPPKETPPTRL